MAAKVTVKVRQSTTLLIASFTFRVLWRFFLGRPMRGGKARDNSSFLKGATRGTPGKALTRWQKKPQVHRAAIRGCVFWPFVGLLALVIWNETAALLALVFSAPFLGFLAFRKGRLIFFLPFSTTDVDTGVRAQHWTFNPKWRRLFHKQTITGVVTRKGRIDPELPIEMQEAIRASIANNELKGESPVFGKIQRYRRDRKAVTE